MISHKTLTRSHFFVAAVSGDDTEPAASASAAAAVSADELQKPGETVTLRQANSNFINGEGNAAYSCKQFTYTNHHIAEYYPLYICHHYRYEINIFFVFKPVCRNSTI